MLLRLELGSESSGLGMASAAMRSGVKRQPVSGHPLDGLLANDESMLDRLIINRLVGQWTSR